VQVFAVIHLDDIAVMFRGRPATGRCGSNLSRDAGGNTFRVCAPQQGRQQ